MSEGLPLSHMESSFGRLKNVDLADHFGMGIEALF